MQVEIPTPNLYTLVATPAILFTIYYIYWQWTTGSKRRSMARQHQCQKIRDYAEFNSFPHNYFSTKTIIENIRALKQHNALESMYGRHLRNGWTIHHKTFAEDITYTLEPENIKAILATRFKDFVLSNRRRRAFMPLLGVGIFTSNGADWQHSRDLLRPNFVRSQVGDLDNFERHISGLIAAIPRNGGITDLQELFFQLTMDSATEFLFGESTNILATDKPDEFKRHFAEAFNRSQEEIAYGIRSGQVRDVFRTKQFWKDCKFAHDFVDRYVQRGLQYRKRLEEKATKGTLDLGKVGNKTAQPFANSDSNGHAKVDVEEDERTGPAIAEKVETTAGAEEEDRYVFLHELVKSISDPIRLRAELLNVLLAGRDTTASLLSSIFHTLARRPDIWAKLEAEVTTTLPEGERPTWTQLKEMRYLQDILREALRLYPPVPYNARMAVRDTVLPVGGGSDGKSPLFIPAHTTVQWVAWAIHRRPDIWGPDSETFSPERWTDGSLEKRVQRDWAYIPFNGGPRVCIGQQYALTEAAYTVVRLVQEFRGGLVIEEKEKEKPWLEMLTLTCAISGGVKIGLLRAGEATTK